MMPQDSRIQAALINPWKSDCLRADHQVRLFRMMRTGITGETPVPPSDEFPLARAHAELCRLIADDGVRRNAVGDENVAIDDRSAADNRVAAEDGGAGVDCYI